MDPLLPSTIARFAIYTMMGPRRRFIIALSAMCVGLAKVLALIIVIACGVMHVFHWVMMSITVSRKSSREAALSATKLCSNLQNLFVVSSVAT
jgi:hypothetical protein